MTVIIDGEPFTYEGVDRSDVGNSGMTAEARAYGQPVDIFDFTPKECEHRNFGIDYVGAVVLDERGEIASREVRVRVRCMECGVPCDINLDRVRRPKDGEAHGIVLVITPEED